jgi:hypothetical protein
MLAHLPAYENDERCVCATSTRLDILKLTDRPITGIHRSVLRIRGGAQHGPVVPAPADHGAQ